MHFNIPFGNFEQFDPFNQQFNHQEDPDNETEIDNEELYNILQIPKGAPIEEVTKAYKVLVRKLHPDKGGNPQQFQTLQQAYEVLKNPQLKEKYDKYGKKGLVANRGQEYKKCNPFVINLTVTLEEVQVGTMKSEKVTVEKICDGCEGKGGKEAHTCSQCKGRKIIEMQMQVGPGMFMVQPAPCPGCQGQGLVFDQHNICQKCKGQTVIMSEIEVEIPIEKGIPSDFTIKLYSKGNERPGFHQGDIIVQIEIARHAQFMRKGADLFYQKEITLVDSLLGVCFDIKTLEGQSINVKYDSVIKPNQIKSLVGKGLPIYGNDLQYGDLNIQFIVKFPTKVTDKDRQLLLSLEACKQSQQAAVKQAINLEVFQIERFEKNQEIIQNNRNQEEEDQGQECQIF